MSHKTDTATLDELFAVGAHFGYSKSRRHPTAKPFVFGAKNGVEIINLEETQKSLAKALDIVRAFAKTGGTILLVGTKPEAREAILRAGLSTGLPYVAERWVGGTLTNFQQMRKRIARLLELKTAKEKGEWGIYTKKEALLLDRELARLEKSFGGVVSMADIPQAMFVVDPRKEKNAMHEAHEKGVPVIALASSDCDFKEITYPIPANDAAVQSVDYFVAKVAETWNAGKREAAPAAATPAA